MTEPTPSRDTLIGWIADAIATRVGTPDHHIEAKAALDELDRRGMLAILMTAEAIAERDQLRAELRRRDEQINSLRAHLLAIARLGRSWSL